MPLLSETLAVRPLPGIQGTKFRNVVVEARRFSSRRRPEKTAFPRGVRARVPGGKTV
jgi:hypothetical protein